MGVCIHCTIIDPQYVPQVLLKKYLENQLTKKTLPLALASPSQARYLRNTIKQPFGAVLFDQMQRLH
jgi:hypothetical protein